MTVTTSKVTATKLVRDALRADGSSSPDYDKIAHDVLDQINPADYKDYLFEFIKLRIPHQVVDNRNVKLNTIKNYAPTGSTERGTPTPQTFIGTDDPAPKLERKTVSAKIDAMRKMVQDAYDERVTISDGSRKKLRELSLADCLWIAEDRRKRAAQNEASADMYDRFATALSTTGKNTLGDVPDEFKAALNPNLV